MHEPTINAAFATFESSLEPMESEPEKVRAVTAFMNLVLRILPHNKKQSECKRRACLTKLGELPELVSDAALVERVLSEAKALALQALEVPK